MGQRIIDISAPLLVDILKGFQGGPPRYFEVVSNALPADVKLVDFWTDEHGRVRMKLESSAWEPVPDGERIGVTVNPIIRAVQGVDAERIHFDFLRVEAGGKAYMLPVKTEGCNPFDCKMGPLPPELADKYEIIRVPAAFLMPKEHPVTLKIKAMLAELDRHVKHDTQPNVLEDMIHELFAPVDPADDTIWNVRK